MSGAFEDYAAEVCVFPFRPQAGINKGNATPLKTQLYCRNPEDVNEAQAHG
jgi:hypothetical protein